MTNPTTFPRRASSWGRAPTLRFRAVLLPVALLLLGACTTPPAGGVASARPGAETSGAPSRRETAPPFDARKEEAVVQAAIAGASDLERAALASGWAWDGARAFAVERYADAARFFFRATRARPGRVDVGAHRSYQDAMLELGQRGLLVKQYASPPAGLGAGERAAWAYLRSRLVENNGAAIDLLNAGLQNMSENSAGVPSGLHLRYLYYGIGVRYLESGNAKAALGAFVKASTQDPTWVEPVMGRYRALTAMNKGEQALRYLRDEQDLFVENDPGFVLLLFSALAESGDWREAERIAARGERAFPDDFRLTAARVYALAASGRKEESRALVNRVLGGLKDKRDYAVVGEVWEKYGQGPLARKVFARAVANKIEPVFFSARYGRSLEKDGRYDEAVEWYRGCRARFPETAYFALALGDACRVAGKKLLAMRRGREAREYLEEALAGYRAYLANSGDSPDLARQGMKEVEAMLEDASSKAK